MAESHTSLAVVLRWRSYGESDKIVTFLTREFGKITGIGKGAKNSRRRFPNSLELLARVRVHFRQKQEASLAFLESCELIGPSSTPEMDPERLAYGAYVVELAEQMTVEWSPALAAYELLDEALQCLERGPATGSFLRAYELKLLACSGFAAPLEGCTQCGDPLSDAAEAYFGPSHGTFWCLRCRDGRDGLFAVTTPVLQRLRSLCELPLERCRDESLGENRESAAQLMGQLLGLHLIRPLRSLRSIEQLTSKNRSPDYS